MQKKVIIIGSGLGGLSTGAILAKNGYEVTVLEQGVQVVCNVLLGVVQSLKQVCILLVVQHMDKL